MSFFAAVLILLSSPLLVGVDALVAHLLDRFPWLWSDEWSAWLSVTGWS